LEYLLRLSEYLRAALLEASAPDVAGFPISPGATPWAAGRRMPTRFETRRAIPGHPDVRNAKGPADFSAGPLS
jgi:hypothetical protein